MPTLTEPSAPIGGHTAQVSLRSGDEVCAVGPGLHGLGGRAADVLPLTVLASQARAATLAVSADGTVMLQRTTASVVVRIDGVTAGVAPMELHHGAQIDFGECRLVLETDASADVFAGRGPAARPMSGIEALGLRPTIASGTARPTMSAGAGAGAGSATDAVLVGVGTGARHPLPTRRIFIGRDDSCEVIVRGNGVSRRHASIAPVSGGFMLRDESANGTLVNGVRIVGTYLLGNGDVVRIQDEELRVELGAAPPPPPVGGEQTALLDLSHIVRGVAEEQARAAAQRTLTASLEIVRGPFAGACFQVERAVCSIGRGEENDVRIRDDTLSCTHATLLRKQGAWFVVDLRSMNGTFVDGSRVSGERELHAGACVRLGGVELVFRAIGSETPAEVELPRRGAWARIKELMRSVAPPSAGR